MLRGLLFVDHPVGFISPPGNDSFWEDLSFTPDVFLFFFKCEISEMRGPTGAKFCTVVYNAGPNFLGGHTPKKISGTKTCKIWLDFGRL